MTFPIQLSVIDFSAPLAPDAKKKVKKSKKLYHPIKNLFLCCPVPTPSIYLSFICSVHSSFVAVCLSAACPPLLKMPTHVRVVSRKCPDARVVFI